MIRCIQIGTTTIQGHVTATYPDPSGEHGAILSMGRVVIGRLIPQVRYVDAVDGVTEHERLIKAPWAESNLQKPQITPTGGGALRAEFPPYRLENKGFWGGAVEVCPLCDIVGCRHIREAGE